LSNGEKFEVKVTAAKVRGSSVELAIEPAAGGAAEALTADSVLLAIGWCPFRCVSRLATIAIK
jgi:dihydrolipoamide dehydrogenase